jgi:hypothetical protein
MDLNMMTFFGSRERTLEDWQSIVHRADPRLSMKVFWLEQKKLIDISRAD